MTGTERLNWLESRRAGIGSSDVAKIVGLSNFGTALDVYLDKVNPPTSVKMAPHLEWGIRHEPVIAAAIMDHYPGWELAKPKTMTHAKYPFLLASPDRMNDFGELIEIKTAERPDGWGEPETAEIPEQYWLQVQHQLEVATSIQPVETCWVFVLIGQGDFRRYRVARDPGYLEAVYDPLREFWTCVENRTPPEPDWNHPKTLDAVKRLCEPKPGMTIDLDAAAKVWAEEYERLGAEIKRLTETRDELKARLIHAMDAAELGNLPDGRSITLKTVHRKGYTVEPCDYLDFRIKKAKGTK